MATTIFRWIAFCTVVDGRRQLCQRRLTCLCALLAVATAATAAAGEALRPFVYPVLSHKVTDGDTIRTELDLGFRIRMDMSARLAGVDAPERNTAAGKAVTAFVKAWCEKQEKLIAVSVAKDPFEGRYVGEIHGDFECLNELLLKKKLVVPYDGKRPRIKWRQCQLDLIEEAARNATAELRETPRGKQPP